MLKTRTIMTIATLGLACAPLMLGPLAAEPAPAATPAHYSVETTMVSTLLADPAAAAVLKQLIPTVYANDMFQQNAGSITLRDVQQYEPEALSNANLAKIQAEFDKLPVKGS